jgi:hypothetical protein
MKTSKSTLISVRLTANGMTGALVREGTTCEELIMSNSASEFKPTINPTETTVQDMFGKILQQRIQDGALEKAITEKVDRMIDDVVSSAFRSYGDIAKSMTDAITASITPNLNELGDFPQYHHYVMQSLKTAVNKFHDEKLKAVLDAEMEDLFKVIPKELTLSWVLDQIKENIKNDNTQDDGFELTLFIETSGKFTHVYIGKEEDQSRWECAYQIDANNGEIYSAKVDNSEPRKERSIGPLYSFEKIIFNAYVMRSTLILDKGLDPMAYDTYVESEYD